MKLGSILQMLFGYFSKADKVKAFYQYDEHDNLISYKIMTFHSFLGVKYSNIYQDGKLISKYQNKIKETNAFVIETLWDMEK